MNKNIDKLKAIIGRSSKVAIFSHTNPDGDALGSCIAWSNILKKMGHDVRFFVPNSYPSFLEWVSKELGETDIFFGKEDQKDFIKNAEVMFFMDLNNLSRTDGMAETIFPNKDAKKILIDHHPEPDTDFDISFSHPEMSSTSLIVYNLIIEGGLEHLLDINIATALYVGMSTDTGNFTFGNLNPELYSALAKIVNQGINPALLNVRLYNNYTKDRMKLLGHLLDNKMVFIENTEAAYIYLSKADQHAFNFKQGDSEGFVNYPLYIEGVNLSAMFIQTNECIKISLRSKGDIDVNNLARKYFNGGGHKNASGGKCFEGMEKAIETFVNAVKEK